MPLIWWATGVITIGIIALTKKTYKESTPETFEEARPWSDLGLYEKFQYLQNLDVKSFTLVIGGAFIMLKLFQTGADIYKTSKRK